MALDGAERALRRRAHARVGLARLAVGALREQPLQLGEEVVVAASCRSSSQRREARVGVGARRDRRARRASAERLAHLARRFSRSSALCSSAARLGAGRSWPAPRPPPAAPPRRATRSCELRQHRQRHAADLVVDLDLLQRPRLGRDDRRRSAGRERRASSIPDVERARRRRRAGGRRQSASSAGSARGSSSAAELAGCSPRSSSLDRRRRTIAASGVLERTGGRQRG